MSPLKNVPAWWVLVCVMLGTTTVSLNNSTVNPAIPVFIHDFHLGPALATWIMVSFMVSMGVTMPLTHYLSQKFGRKSLYLTGLSLFILGSLIGALANSIEMVLLARAVQGVSSGLMIPLSLAIIYSMYPKSERGRVTGLWGAAVMISPAVGPLCGSLILEFFSWKALFLINVPIALTAFLVGVKTLPHSVPDQKHPFDLIGYLLIAVGIGLLLITLGKIQSLAALTDATNVMLIIGALACLLVFGRRSFRIQHPLLNLKLFFIKGYRSSVIIAVALAVGMFESLFLLPLLIQIVLGYSPILTGMLLLYTAIAASIFSHIAGRLLDKYGPRVVVSLGIIITSGATLGFAFIDESSPLWLLCTLAVLRGCGIGMSYIPITTAGISALPDAMVTQGAVMNNISRRLIASLMLVMASLWLEHSLSVEQVSSTILYASAISEVFIAISLFIALVLPFAMNFPRISNQTTDGVTDLDSSNSIQNGLIHNKSIKTEHSTLRLHSDNKDEVLR